MMTDTPALFDRPFLAPETYDAFFTIVDRLETTLADEKAALDAGRHAMMAEITRQKRQGFLELGRIMGAMEGRIPSQDIVARLTAFRTTLAANAALLTTHLHAAREVTATIMRVMHDQESDGTYSRHAGHSAYDFA